VRGDRGPRGPALLGGDETIVASLGSTIRRIRRSEVRYAQAQGDYTRLHTEGASYLIRVPISDLEQQWGDGGFLRVHRSFLVQIEAVTSIHLGPHPLVTVCGVDLPVSRRLLPVVRDVLASTTRRGHPRHTASPSRERG
jgi:DNA-binding LytR/AlgR family response regulator